MKKHSLILFAAPIAAVILVSGTLYPEGSPGAKTGSPLDGATCAQCHTGNVTEVSWISSDIPTQGWAPGETYTLTLTATPDFAALIGFEVTAESGNSKVGTFMLKDDRTQYTNNRKAVTHSHLGTTPTDGINSWQIDWKAPTDDLESVSFYAAFNAANGNGSTSGDKIYASTVTYEKAQSTDVNETDELTFRVFPNPANDYLFIQSATNLNKVSFYTLNGSLIKSFEGLQSGNTRLNISELPKGFYMIKSHTTENEFVRRIQLN